MTLDDMVAGRLLAAGLDPEDTERVVRRALDEDLRYGPDVTSAATARPGVVAVAGVVAREPGVLAGLPVALAVLDAAAIPPAAAELLRADGDRIDKGTEVLRLRAPLRELLGAERTLLNFLTHLSGVATATRAWTDALSGTRCRVRDTRKTTPGLRQLEKYAVRCGGGHNHRMGLYDGILIKDNHLAAMPISDWALRIEDAVRRGHAACGARPVEIEVENLDQFVIALDGLRPVIILLDNMSLEQIRDAVARRNAECDSESERQQVLLEASGGVTLQTVRAIAETGVDRISVGALTHSAPALDIALDYQHGR
jgi:nicotinate-nucleotide pyrophosphorylase (carboxylating)